MRCNIWKIREGKKNDIIYNSNSNVSIDCGDFGLYISLKKMLTLYFKINLIYE